MSLSRSSAATAILRALARSSSPAQQPKTCFECLVNPTSCQISHIAAGASAASRGSGQPFPRYQSTSSTPTVTSDIAASSSTAIPQQRARVASSANAEEAPIATTSAEPSTSNVVAGQSQPEKPLPTLDDLDALKSRKLTVPDEAEPATSAVVGMYTRRFKNLYSRVNRAFNKEQVAHLARAASIISNHETHRPKAELVRKLMTDYWDLTDPALYAVRESGRSRHDSQQPQDVVEGRNADLLQRLMYKTQVKASVRSHPSVLRLTGPLGQVEAVRAEWTRTKAEIRTDILETHLSKRLRPDLYKSLSMVSDAFVAPHSKSAKQIKVSYRTRQKGPVGKVEAALRHLRLQESVLSKSPQFALVDPHSDDNAFMPVVPQSSPAWDLLAVPPTALTRFTSMNPQQSARSLYRARDTKSEQREEDLQSALLNPLAEVDGSLKVKASFGHLLRVNDQPPLPVALSKMADWAAKYYDAFLPATPDGIANRYNVNLRRYEPGRLREHTEDLKVSSRRLRRLVYIPLGNLTPMKYLQFERPLFSRHQSEAMQSTGDAEETSVWTGEHGLRSFVHIAIPQNLTDLRLEASKTGNLPKNVVQTLEPISVNAPPVSFTWNDQIYYIVEDTRVQEMVFISGLPQALNVNMDILQPVLERRTDTLFPPNKRATAFELRSRSSEDIDAILPMVLRTL